VRPARCRVYPATLTARCSANPGKPRPSQWRSPCTRAGCSPGPNANEIKRAQGCGDPDTGETYYRHWLATLEKIVATKGIATSDTLHCYREAWDHAADRTPHGSPIELKPEDFV